MENENFIRVGTTLYKIVNQPYGTMRRYDRTMAKISLPQSQSMTAFALFPTM